jgi:hypothetical protein
MKEFAVRIDRFSSIISASLYFGIASVECVVL